MSLFFTKMHGLGNDFIVIDGIHQTITLSAEHIRQLADRRTGIGFDQCLLVEKSTQPGIDFFYRIFNANGLPSGQCGNGARCLARFIHDKGLSTKPTLNVATATTRMTLELHADNTVTVAMECPRWAPKDIPLSQPHQASRYALPMPDTSVHLVHALSVGNPHAVTQVDNIHTAPVLTLGQQISEHPFFTEQTNAEFMQIISLNHLLLRVYERGCGETQACGSGAVAAAAVGRLFYGMDPSIRVTLPGGELTVDWPDYQGPIYLTGEAVVVYEGQC